MAFLRLLTNPRIMSEDILSPAEAIAVYRQLFSDERVRFEAEPPNLEDAWLSLMSMHSASGSAWTDAYLAAFAMEAKFRLIIFDRGMRRWSGLALELPIPAWRSRLHHGHLGIGPSFRVATIGPRVKNVNTSPSGESYVRFTEIGRSRSLPQANAQFAATGQISHFGFALLQSCCP